jgi:hypothetical protein
MSTNEKAKVETSAREERRELVPLIIAGIVAAISLLYLCADLSGGSLGRGDGATTSAVVSRTGVTVTPSEQQGHLSAHQSTSTATVGRVTQ